MIAQRRGHFTVKLTGCRRRSLEWTEIVAARFSRLEFAFRVFRAGRRGDKQPGRGRERHVRLRRAPDTEEHQPRRSQGQGGPDQGEIRVAGRTVNRLSHDELFALRRKMGMLFQFGALFTDLSSFDNVAFQMREHTNLPEPLIRDLALMKLQAVGLRGAADLMPSELSGGMARRVALARSIALDPMLMMYDEPFTGLDPISLGVIGQLIRRLNDSLGATSIVVTHDVAEALDLVDYVYYMSAGKVEFQGTPDEVRAAGLSSLRQFVYGEPDGPVPFHYPAPDYRQDLLAQ